MATKRKPDPGKPHEIPGTDEYKETMSARQTRLDKDAGIERPRSHHPDDEAPAPKDEE